MPFPTHRRSDWKLRTRSLALGCRTRVMGILNVTPDSFSDGGHYLSANAAIDCALRMFEAGAAVVDIGGESTRPGARPISSAEEQNRILPVLEGILRRQPDAILSVDTYHADTAEAALRAGAQIINDVSGLTWDPSMAEVIATAGCGVVIMHTRGRPEEWKDLPRLHQSEILPKVKGDLGARLAAALSAGITRERIVLDPGLGFGKIHTANFPLLAGLASLLELGQPLMVGASRKSFLARAMAPLHNGSDAGVESRENASLAASVIAILAGADLVRTHDVRATVEAAAIADATLSASL